MSNQHIFIGKPLTEVEAICQASGVKYRVTRFNGSSRILTMDYRPDRLNFKVENNIIVDVNYG